MEKLKGLLMALGLSLAIVGAIAICTWVLLIGVNIVSQATFIIGGLVFLVLLFTCVIYLARQ